MKLMRINCDFKHDGVQYYAGEVRNLSRELSGYFSAAGWAGDTPPEAAPVKPVTLQVQNIKHGIKSTPPGSK